MLLTPLLSFACLLLLAAPPSPAPVVAAFTAEAGKREGQAVAFDASGTRDADRGVERYDWDFGDGDSAEGKDAQHVYSSAGSYVVKLTVSGAGIETVELEKTVVILPPPDAASDTAEPPIPLPSPSMSVDVLLGRLRGKDTAGRARAAVEAAGVAPNDELIEALEAATRDDSEQVRAAAVRTLEQLRPAPDHYIDRAAEPLETPGPKYPPDAFVKKIEGTVTVQISIDATGRVTNAKVVKSIPPLDAAALATVRRWTFQPALVRGRPVGETREVPVKFAIF